MWWLGIQVLVAKTDIEAEKGNLEYIARHIFFLNHTKLLIAGSPNYGWDVYSLEGEFLERLEPMSLDEAANFLNFKKRNHQ